MLCLDEDGVSRSKTATNSCTDKSSENHTHRNTDTNITKDCLTEDRSKNNTQCHTNPYILLSLFTHRPSLDTWQ